MDGARDGSDRPDGRARGAPPDVAPRDAAPRDAAPRALDLIVSGGRVATPAGLEAKSIGIAAGRIVALAPTLELPAAEHLRADGLVVLPGLVDPHVHLGLPTAGTRTSDDPASGTAAALHGGVTTVIDFTLQRGAETLADTLAARRAEFEGVAHCDHAFHVNVTRFGDDFAERIDAELEALAALGSCSLKVFTCYSEIGYAIARADLRTLLGAARRHRQQLLVHAEADALVRRATEALVAAGRTGPAHYPASRPAAAEAQAVRDVVEVAADAGASLYLVHVSTAGALAAVRTARRAARAPVHLETCPHYLVLDDDRYAGPEAAQALVAPPLRSPEDRRALVEAYRNGTIDVVATDHCCFARAQKARAGARFTELPKGLAGIETRLALLHTLVGPVDDAGWRRLVDCLASNAAKIFGLAPQKGAIRPGADADLVLFDPDHTWTIEAARLATRSDVSAYEGMRVRGRVCRVLLRGRTVLADGERCSVPGGRFVTRSAPESGF
ncbi:MAG: amidohydrolase family protein [Candidatus Eiseniibacteriota bacterium]|jgi:dihydropyrimidinase